MQPIEQPSLTSRETEIINDIIRGLNSKEIAYRYSIALSTVWNHRSHIMKKLGCTSVPEAVARFIKSNSGYSSCT